MEAARAIRVGHRRHGVFHVLLERGAHAAFVAMERHERLGQIPVTEPSRREQRLEDRARVARGHQAVQIEPGSGQGMRERLAQRESRERVEEVRDHGVGLRRRARFFPGLDQLEEHAGGRPRGGHEAAAAPARDGFDADPLPFVFAPVRALDASPRPWRGDRSRSASSPCAAARSVAPRLRRSCRGGGSPRGRREGTDARSIHP